MRAADRRVSNLPADLTSFVGRRHEVGDVKARLSSARLVTLTGMGGVGKTRLALRVAWELRRVFRDGVWLVELAALRDPDLVAQTVAAALGIHDRSQGSSTESLIEQFGQRQMLLVLDNCEHLLEACAVLADSMLRACPQLRILATSRQALGIGGEHLLVVPPLSVPDRDVGMSPEGLIRYEAVNLFVDRAAAVRPGFRLDQKNKAAVIGICQHLDGVPLAVELAASRLRTLSVEQVMLRLDERYTLLTGGNRAALPRQQTLRALIDWSFELCSNAERLLWGRTSVFLGGFDLNAAEQVCADPKLPPAGVLDVLSNLVDKSILIAYDEHAELRYRLPETLRAYGSDRLAESSEADAFGRRHRDWCRRLVAEAHATWFGADQVRTFARLRLEHANLREALNFCLLHHDAPKSGLEMAAKLRFYWVVSGRLNEGRHWIDRLLNVHDEPDSVRLSGLCTSAYLSAVVGDFTTATGSLREARSLAVVLGDSSGAALVTQVEGLTALFQNDPAGASRLFEDALATHRATGDQAAAIYDQVEIAVSATLLGHTDRAIGLLEECLTVTESRGECWLRALTLWALGIEECRRGSYQRAASAELESIRLRLPFEDRWSIGLNLHVLAWTAAATGAALRAARLLGAAEAITYSVGSSPANLGHLADLQLSFETMARRRLADSGFELAVEEGRRLTFDEAVRMALGDRGAPGNRVSVAPNTTESILTRREREVAELLARGMTNKQIAHALVISPRTAETHVERILTKLGLTSRTQVVAWITDNSERDREHGEG
jgi:predicted ATPase/DNA-binding CsgD family transcriptional regulator